MGLGVLGSGMFWLCWMGVERGGGVGFVLEIRGLGLGMWHWEKRL